MLYINMKYILYARYKLQKLVFFENIKTGEFSYCAISQFECYSTDIYQN
jgi:hypothetical protein